MLSHRDKTLSYRRTVLLETEWVLRSAYRYSQTRIVEALSEFLGLTRVTPEGPAAAAKALAWAAVGVDFADALHLAGSAHCDAFVSFDRRLAAAAQATDGPPVREP